MSSGVTETSRNSGNFIIFCNKCKKVAKAKYKKRMVVCSACGTRI